MKDTISENQTIVSRTGGIISQVLRTFSRILSMLIFGCVLSVLVEVVGVTFFWADQGAGKSVGMVAAEMNHLGRIADRNPVLGGLDDWVIGYLSEICSPGADALVGIAARQLHCFTHYVVALCFGTRNR